MTGKIYFLTAVHNELESTKKLLSCIAEQNHKNIETYLVDDGSTDGTFEYVARKYPKVKIIKGDGKLWWTGALYTGVERILRTAVEGDFILTINNDCEFGKNYVTEIVSVADRNKKSIVGSLIIDKSDGRIWDSGVFVDWKRGVFFEKPEVARRNIKRGVPFAFGFDFLPTKGTLFPIEVFKEVGNFDKKNLPHYISDYEFTARAKRNGWELFVSYRAKLLNETKRTGFGDSKPKTFSLVYFFRLLFSRRSKANIIDHLNFIRLACPGKYKPLNYLLRVLKIFHYLLHVPPFTLIPRTILNVKRLLGLQGVAIVNLISGRKGVKN